jgi:vitamin B12 transporter
LPVAAPQAQTAAEPVVRFPSAAALDDVVVTATRLPTSRSQLAGTLQVIHQGVIRRSVAQNVTDQLAENAVGFFSTWTPGQTSLNIHGGA